MDFQVIQTKAGQDQPTIHASVTLWFHHSICIRSLEISWTCNWCKDNLSHSGDGYSGEVKFYTIPDSKDHWINRLDIYLILSIRIWSHRYRSVVSLLSEIWFIIPIKCFLLMDYSGFFTTETCPHSTATVAIIHKKTSLPPRYQILISAFPHFSYPACKIYPFIYTMGIFHIMIIVYYFFPLTTEIQTK